ncbi:uncharacterized protein LOC108671286 [Hyalella azteca]|uniref:Uncharacterized protein LOC108671286 n=1 Tax=Hyalella azteca TaxID=294128 RepID=A0A8B7NKU1_HYAAZ|nr:uncharacterized protein LOC108671286 [Hyalella azteca]
MSDAPPTDITATEKGENVLNVTKVVSETAVDDAVVKPVCTSQANQIPSNARTLSGLLSEERFTVTPCETEKEVHNKSEQSELGRKKKRCPCPWKAQPPPRPFKKARYAWQIKNYEHTVSRMKKAIAQQPQTLPSGNPGSARGAANIDSIPATNETKRSAESAYYPGLYGNLPAAYSTGFYNPLLRWSKTPEASCVEIPVNRMLQNMFFSGNEPSSGLHPLLMMSLAEGNAAAFNESLRCEDLPRDCAPLLAADVEGATSPGLQSPPTSDYDSSSDEASLGDDLVPDAQMMSHFPPSYPSLQQQQQQQHLISSPQQRHYLSSAENAHHQMLQHHQHNPVSCAQLPHVNAMPARCDSPLDVPLSQRRPYIADDPPSPQINYSHHCPDQTNNDTNLAFHNAMMNCPISMTNRHLFSLQLHNFCERMQANNNLFQFNQSYQQYRNSCARITEFMDEQSSLNLRNCEQNNDATLGDRDLSSVADDYTGQVQQNPIMDSLGDENCSILKNLGPSLPTNTDLPKNNGDGHQGLPKLSKLDDETISNKAGIEDVTVQVNSHDPSLKNPLLIPPVDRKSDNSHNTGGITEFIGAVLASGLRDELQQHTETENTALNPLQFVPVIDASLSTTDECKQNALSTSKEPLAKNVNDSKMLNHGCSGRSDEDTLRTSVQQVGKNLTVDSVENGDLPRNGMDENVFSDPEDVRGAVKEDCNITLNLSKAEHAKHADTRDSSSGSVRGLDRTEELKCDGSSAVLKCKLDTDDTGDSCSIASFSPKCLSCVSGCDDCSRNFSDRALESPNNRLTLLTCSCVIAKQCSDEASITPEDARSPLTSNPSHGDCDNLGDAELSSQAAKKIALRKDDSFPGDVSEPGSCCSTRERPDSVETPHDDGDVCVKTDVKSCSSIPDTHDDAEVSEEKATSALVHHICDNNNDKFFLDQAFHVAIKQGLGYQKA